MVVLLSCCLGVCLCVLRDVGYQEVAFVLRLFMRAPSVFFFFSFSPIRRSRFLGLAGCTYTKEALFVLLRAREWC